LKHQTNQEISFWYKGQFKHSATTPAFIRKIHRQ